MIPWAIDDLVISDDVLWQSALKDAHGLPAVNAQLAERFGRWPAFGGLARPGRRLSLVTLWNHATPALRAAAKRQFEQYVSPEREVIRRLAVGDSSVPGVAPSSVLLALGPWNVARSGSTYAPRHLLNPATVATVAGGLIFPTGPAQVAQATTNLFTNPSMETDITGWAGAGTRTQDSTQYLFGTKSLKITRVGAGGLTERDVTATTSANTQYTFSIWVRGTGSVKIGLWDNVANYQYGAFTAVSNSAWTRIAVTLTFGAGSTSRYVEITGDSTQTVYIDGVQLEQKVYATPYCDGSLGPGHSWTGTAHASTSSRTAATLYLANPLSLTAGTISLWWTPSADNTGTTRSLFSEGNLQAYFNAADDKIYFTDGTNPAISTAALTFSAETAMHLVFTWAAGALNIYRNGVNVATGATYTAPTAGASLYLGSDAAGAYQCDGLIDRLLVLGVALTAAQVATLYAATSSNFRWCNVIAEEVKAFAIGGEETDQGVVSTLAVDGDVRWRSRAGAAFWRIYGDTSSFALNNGGDEDAYPIFYITPKTAKTGAYAYKCWCPIIWRATAAGTKYPMALTVANTNTLVGAGKMLASGNDLRVIVDGVEVDRWLDAPNSASTKVWFNANWQAAVTAAAADTTDSATTITATTDISGFPSTGIIYIGTETITYTGKSNAAMQFTGCTRGAKGSTAATHAAGATIYWVQHDVWIKYGNASAAAPTVDANSKPAFELDHSTNQSWVYESFGDDALQRSGQWVFNTADSRILKTTANHGTTATPWTDIGIDAYIYDTAYWVLYNPCGITQGAFSNGEKYKTDSGYFFGAVESSADGSSWTNLYSIPSPSSTTTWEAWSATQAMTGKYIRLRAGMASNNAGHDVYVEVADVTLTLDSNVYPQVAVTPEQSNYDLAVTLTNSTTGDSIVLAAAMQLNQTLAVDTDAKTITLLADGSRQLQALTLTGGARRDWLRLAAGSNTLTWSDVGTVSVEVDVLFDRRYFE